MALIRALEIAGTGLSAQSVRLDAVASNLANVDSVSSSIAETYRARVPVFAAIFEPELEGVAKVEVKGIVESPSPIEIQYHPGHPMADADGYVYYPNINPIEQLADMISASRSYQDNLEVANTAKQLLQRTLELGQLK